MQLSKLTIFFLAFTPLSILAQDNNDLLKKDSSNHVVCYFPVHDILTPNGDGLNDCFPYMDSLNNFTEIKITIFNGSGMIIFENNDSTKCWNGKINNSGPDCPEGAYYYLFENKKENKPVIKGTINLIRNSTK